MATKTPQYDLQRIFKAVNAVIGNQLYEVRLIDGTSARKKISSGYFKGTAALEKALSRANMGKCQAYITINSVKEECYSRVQHDQFMEGAATTSDSDISAYRWLFIDLDPVRAAGISSSAEELEAARALSERVAAYMKQKGFSRPLYACSGNGYHLLYRVDIPNTKETSQMMQNCLEALALRFNTEAVKIDTVNYNASRICKLYGTVARKGAHTEERPHRMSYLIGYNDGDVYAVNSVDLLKALAAELPEKIQPPKPQAGRYDKAPFDVLDFMSKYGLTHSTPREWNDATMYPLDECPFDHSHAHGEAKIFVFRDGCLGFKCPHNSCNGKTWRDVRTLFEPDAYSKEYTPPRSAYKATAPSTAKASSQTVNTPAAIAQEITDEATADKLEELQGEAVKYLMPEFKRLIETSDQRPCYPTGFNSLDAILNGGLRPGLYIMGAISAAGKTTFCTQITDNIAAAGNDVLIFSLEMSKYELIAKSVSRLMAICDDSAYFTMQHAKSTVEIMDGSQMPKWTDEEKSVFMAAMDEYTARGEHIYINEGVGNIGIEQISARVKQHAKLTGKAPVVLIDYLQIMAPADPKQSDKQNTDKAVLELKRLSRDMDTPVIAISNFNRDNYDEPVNMSSFKESGAIEYTSDVLMGLQYEFMDYVEGEKAAARTKRIIKDRLEQKGKGYNGHPRKMQLKVLKNRNGQEGDFKLDFYSKYNYFEEPYKKMSDEG